MPIAPPKVSEASDTTFSTTMPKASVTIARLGPFTRNEGTASSAPNAAETAQARTNASHGLRLKVVVASAAV